MNAALLVERTVQAMARKSPDEIKRVLFDDDWIKLALSALHTRLERAERDAVRIYFEAVEAIGGEQERAILVFCSGLGLSDPEQVRRLVEMARGADGATLADSRRSAVALLRGIMRVSPDERARLREELFGEREIAEVGPGTPISAPVDSEPYRHGENGHTRQPDPFLNESETDRGDE